MSNNSPTTSKMKHKYTKKICQPSHKNEIHKI